MNLVEKGEMAEEIAFSYEKARVAHGALSRLVSADTTLGYDIESVESKDQPFLPRFIEVKAVSAENEIIVTENELKVLKALADRAFLYVVDVTEKKVIKIYQNPFKGDARYTPHSYRMYVSKELV